MNEVEQYLIDYKGRQRELMLYLHSLLTEEFDLHPKWRYKLPFYDARSWICYLNPRKDGGLDVSFINGQALGDWKPFLQSRDRKMVASLVYYDLSDVDEKVLRKIVRAAIELEK